MSYIHTYSTISIKNTFKTGILKSINRKEILENKLQNPDYKEIISIKKIRRMSQFVRMGLANAIQCSKNKKIDGIIVGTGLGCLSDTRTFLSSYINNQNHILSPTPFINSVHNTVASEIAIYMNIQGYNCTHSQDGLSFEVALIDAYSLTQEKQQILLGGIDEKISLIDEISLKLHHRNQKFSLGSSFFLLSNLKKGAKAKIETCKIINKQNLEEHLRKWNYSKNHDFIIQGNSSCKNHNTSIDGFNYSDLSGIYMSNSSFGLQLAVEILNQNKKIKLGKFNTPEKTNRIFIINLSSFKDIGLIIISKT